MMQKKNKIKLHLIDIIYSNIIPAFQISIFFI